LVNFARDSPFDVSQFADRSALTLDSSSFCTWGIRPCGPAQKDFGRRRVDYIVAQLLTASYCFEDLHKGLSTAWNHVIKQLKTRTFKLSNALARSETAFEPDELDLKLLEVAVQEPEINFKRAAQLLNVDQRTVAKRFRALKSSGVLRQAVEIDWSKLGLQAQALVGWTTTRGNNATKLDELIRTDPRIVEASETLGANQFSMRVIDRDMATMRDSVLKDLDPLAAELSVSMITKRTKRDYHSLLLYLRKTKFPRSVARDRTLQPTN